jgi:transglutaminase-like putative cysteine protease
MKRRDFIVAVSAGATALSLPEPSFAKSVVATNKEKSAEPWKTVEITTKVTTSAEGPLQLWLPVPLTKTSYQELLSTEWEGEFTRAGLFRDKVYDAEVLYVMNQKAATLEFSVTHKVNLRNRVSAEQGSSEDVGFYLQPTKHVPIDGVVKETAQKIIKSASSNDAKARAIYDWMVVNTTRDPKIQGCGLGDVKTTLTSGNLSGKCADLSSLYVALCRSVGVPAREVFGLRVLPSKISKATGKSGDVSKGQHCRAEYYSKQRGWVPVDPADVRKIILEEELAAGSPRIGEISKKLFGSWEMNWVAFNSARDFALPGSAQENLNYLMYPRMLTEKVQKDGIDPDQFKYTITAKEIS